MSNPKEKAKELFEKYDKNIVSTNYKHICKEALIQCALISVDEIIFALNDDIYIQGETDIDSHREYWQEVKQEINKL